MINSTKHSENTSPSQTLPKGGRRGERGQGERGGRKEGGEGGVVVEGGGRGGGGILPN